LFLTLSFSSSPLSALLIIGFNESLVAEHLADCLMSDLSLINSKSDWELFLEHGGEILEFSLIHEWKLHLIVGIEFFIANFELMQFVIVILRPFLFF
jgi:hypothetical protein